MGYQKNVWTDRVVQFANRYLLTLISGSVYDITPEPGTVTNAGTARVAAYMNNIEAGILAACPAGTMIMWPSKWEPDQWMVRDGSELLRATYADMFNNLTKPRNLTVTIASPAVFSLTGHRFTEGDPVRFETTGALPTGLSTSTTYYVISTGLTADTFRVSTSVGGAAVNTSGSQSGTHTVRYFGVLGVGNGTTTFTLPDDRGYSERAWDGGRGVDTGRVFGSYQADEFKAHAHKIRTSASSSSSTYGLLYGASNGQDGVTGNNTGPGGTFVYNDYSGNPIIDTEGTASETRGKNRAYLPIIRY